MRAVSGQAGKNTPYMCIGKCDLIFLLM